MSSGVKTEREENPPLTSVISVQRNNTAQETFTLFKGLTDSEYKIIAHQIDGAALLTE